MIKIKDNKIPFNLMFYLMLLIIIFPFIWMIFTSLKSSSEIIHFPPTFFPSEISFQNYRELVLETNIVKYFYNSIITAIFTILITVISAFMTAYCLARYNNSLTKTLAAFSLLAYMVAPIMFVIPLIEVFKSIKLLNTRFSLVLAHTVICYPFAVWILRSYLKSIPKNLEQCASIDGANFIQTLLYIIIPNAAPGLMAASIFTFILSWNDYILALIFTNSDSATLPVELIKLTSQPYVNWGVIMSTGVLISLPIILILVFFGNRITTNLNLSLNK